MEMDGGTATIGIITLALLIMPFVLDYRRRKRIGINAIRALKDGARLQGCELHKYDAHREIALGIDIQKKVLFFLSNSTNATGVQHVHLTQMSSCEVIKAGRGASAAKIDEPIERVELFLKAKDKSHTDVRFVLHREVGGSSLNGEVQLAEKWAGLVKELLRM